MLINFELMPEAVLELELELGEGPLWDARTGHLWFVDIKRDTIHRFSPTLGDQASWHFGGSPSALAVAADGLMLVTNREGVWLFDPVDGSRTLVSLVEANLPGNRLNDGCCDSTGRFWLGSMDDAEAEKTGSLYVLDTAKGLHQQDTGYCITNGPAFSPDGLTMYHTSTLERVIFAFAVDPATGAISGKRVFHRFSGADGYPDGLTVDTNGRVWSGQFGGWGVACISPAGERIGQIRFPTANVTKCAFGDADRSTLYCTTARKGLSARELAEQPLAGAVFACRPGVTGLLTNCYGT